MKDRMYEAIKNAILSHKRWKGKDIYAAMIVIEWDVMGDVLDILINCNRDQFTNMGPLNLEERWDYSHWGDRNEINIVPEIINDTEIVQWLLEMGVERVGEDIDGQKLVKGGREVLQMLKETAAMLLEDEEIAANIGVDTPILIHELEYFEPYISTNIELNEGKMIKSYLKWMEK